MQYHEFCILHFKLSPSNLDHFGPFLIVLFLVLLTSFGKTNLIFGKTKGCCLKSFSHLSCHFQVFMQKISMQYHEFWILHFKLSPSNLYHFGRFLIVLFLVLLTSFGKTNLIFGTTKGSWLKSFSNLSFHFPVFMQKISMQYHEF